MKIKHFLAIIYVSFACQAALAQQEQEIKGTSPKYTFNITKEVRLPIISFVSGSVQFVDANGNKMIDANESCKIVCTIQNTGNGDAFGLKALLGATGETTGIAFENTTPIPMLKAGQDRLIEIPVTADMSSAEGTVVFNFKVDEPGGFGTDPIDISVPTVKFASPFLEVVDYTVSSKQSSILSKKVPFDLSVVIQNTQIGYGESVSVTLQLPANVVCLSGNEMIEFPIVKPAEKQNITYSLIISDKFLDENIPITIKILERFGKYASDRTILLQMNQSITNEK